MGLKKIECKNCKTKYWGDDREGRDDGYCFLCSTTRKFLKFFDLEDLEINEVDFNRVRNPMWMKVNVDNPKDWRNYIPQGLKDMWNRFPVESRILAIMFAEREARAVDIVSSVVAKGVK